MAVIDNRLDPALDIAGSLNQQENLVKNEEPLQYGSRIPGQIGFTASIINSGVVTISGLSGMTDQSVGRFLTLFGATNSNNNGTFLITLFNSPTSVDIKNDNAVNDLNNGHINWIERKSYSLEDDLNYIRTDRADIKGVGYSADVPTYFRCDDSVTPIPANLANIAGHTTDAKSLVNSRKYERAMPITGQSYIRLAGTLGEFPYANLVNRLGIPIHDGFDSSNDYACYCDIISQDTGAGFNVLSGSHSGEKIFGFSRKGSTGVDGTSFEVELRSMKDGYSFSQSSIYLWEPTQPNVVDVYFPYRECFADMDESALRFTVVHGVTAGGISVKPTAIGQILYSVESDNLIFTVEQPIVNDESLIMVNDDDVILVM